MRLSPPRLSLAPFICLIVFFGCALPCLAQDAANAQPAPNVSDAQSAAAPGGPSDDDQSTEPLKQLSLDQLGNVEVTSASKEPTEVWQTPAAIFVITHDDILRSGATSIPEALRMAPGVEVARIDANKWAIGIRGFGTDLTRSVLVLIDGRTVYSPLFDGTYWNVQNVMMDDVDRIEVIRGPGGTIWGPNAVNGVINIITRSSHDTHGKLVTTGAGNEEQGFVDAREGGGNDKLDYRVYGEAFNRGPEYHATGPDFDRWRNVQAGFRMDWKANSRDSFTFQGDMYDEGAGESTQATSYTQPYSEIVDGTARLSGGNVMARWKRVMGDGDDVQVQGYYDRTNRHEMNFGDLRNTYDVDYLQRHRLRGRQQLSWGLGARASEGDELELFSGLMFVPHQRTDELYSAFVQDDIALIEHRLTLEVGTKLLRTNYTGVEPQPSGRLLWTPSRNQTLWLAFTHAVRTPSDVERDYFLSGYIGTAPNGLPYFARFNANPDFKPEQLNGEELGYRRLIGPKVYVDVSAFYNHYHNLLSEEITGPSVVETTPTLTYLLLPAQFRNGLLGNTKGFEIAPEWRPTGFWRLRGSYSYLHMSLRKSATSQDVGVAPITDGSSPAHQLQLESSLDLSKSVTLDLSARYISALPALGVTAYTTGNATLGWSVNPHFRVSLVGDNLLQPHHAEDGGDPAGLVEIQRSAYAKLTWTAN